MMGRVWNYDKKIEFKRKVLRALKSLENDKKIYRVVR